MYDHIGLKVKDVGASVRFYQAALGALPGSLGAVGVSTLPVIADVALRGRRNMATGANIDDVHLTGVDVDRDIAVGTWADLREVTAGEPCPRCGTPLELVQGIEVGHIFKLGRKFTTALGASVLGPDGAAINRWSTTTSLPARRIARC